MFRGNVRRDFSINSRQDEFILPRGDGRALAAKVNDRTGPGRNPEQDRFPPADVSLNAGIILSLSHIVKKKHNTMEENLQLLNDGIRWETAGKANQRI